MARRTTVLVSAALAAAALVAFTVPGIAGAAGPTTVTDPGGFPGPGQEFCGTYTGTLNPGETGQHSCDLDGHMVGVKVDGIPAVVYSTRFDRAIGDSSTTTGTEVDFAAPGSGFDSGEADQAARVLANYYPNTNSGLAEQYQITGTDDQMATAVQAAIWHIGDDITMDLETELGDTTETDFVTYANYLHILDAVHDRALPTGLDDLSLEMTPPPDNTPVVNGLWGPIVVTTNAASVEVSSVDDIRITDAAGNTISRVFQDGDSFWLEPPGIGTYDLNAEVEGIQNAEVLAWHLTTDTDELAMPLGYAASEPWRFTQDGTFTIYEVQAQAADPVASDPQFTG